MCAYGNKKPRTVLFQNINIEQRKINKKKLSLFIFNARCPKCENSGEYRKNQGPLSTPKSSKFCKFLKFLNFFVEFQTLLGPINSRIFQKWPKLKTEIFQNFGNFQHFWKFPLKIRQKYHFFYIFDLSRD